MKKVFLSLLFAGLVIFSVEAKIDPIDTTNPSPDLMDSEFGWWEVSETLSVLVDTGTALVDTNTWILKAHVKKGAAIGDSIYPYFEIISTFNEDTNFNGVTAIRLTYKSIEDWYCLLPDKDMNLEINAPHQAQVPAAADWTTIYLNVLDTVNVFLRPSWVEPPDRTPLNLFNVLNIGFIPKDDNDLGVEATIEIKDVRLFNYGGINVPIKIPNNKKAALINISAFALNSNTINFKVPVDGIYNVSITSLNGKTISSFSHKFLAGKNNAVTMKNKPLAAGIYFANIATGTKVASLKLLVQ